MTLNFLCDTVNEESLRINMNQLIEKIFLEIESIENPIGKYKIHDDNKELSDISIENIQNVVQKNDVIKLVKIVMKDHNPVEK